ncbi:unnamed protein product, partial [Timema podura]|nr:unnamed protein product [Timema podura]
MLDGTVREICLNNIRTGRLDSSEHPPKMTWLQGSPPPPSPYYDHYSIIIGATGERVSVSSHLSLVIAGLSDLSRPAEKLSVPQSAALSATGLVWSRYSMVIIPKNWSLFSVNVFCGRHWALLIWTCRQRLSNGAIEPDSDMARVIELQNTIDKQTTELSTWQRRVSELTSRVSELEESHTKTQKELLKAQEANVKLQRDLRENVAQKEDQEERIATLEKRYLNAQRESTSLHDLNEKLEQELQHKEAQLKV